MSTTGHPRPLLEVALLLDECDHLAIARRDLPAGTRLVHAGHTLLLREGVRAKQKLALVPLRAGQVVRLYGAPVGVATADISPGDPIVPGILSDQLPVAPADAVHSPPPALAPPSPIPTFLGIDRGPGGVGTRHYLLVAYTVPCAATVAARITTACRAAFGFHHQDPDVADAHRLAHAPDEAPALPEPDFPGVDDIVLLHHQSGCGMPNHGDLEALARWLAHTIRNPNVGAALVLGLGCEKADVAFLERHFLGPVRETTGKPIRTLSHHASGSEAAFVRAGIDAVCRLLDEMAGVRRTPVPLSRLVLGTKCGGSDGFSGVSANPVLGWVSDCVAASGGSVLLGEVPEMHGAEETLAARAASAHVARQVLGLVRRYAERASRDGVRLAENPSQGNIADGLLTIQMKSLGAVRKGGTGPVAGVLDYGEWVPGSGLFLLDTPGYDAVSTAALPGSGATLIGFTTGLGTPLGNPIAPVIKIASNSDLAARMPDVIDFDAGTVIAGAETVAECGARLLQKVLAVASGERTCNERNGHRESTFWQRQLNL